MSHYYAHFLRHGARDFRFDTRIYLNAVSAPSDDDVCIAAIVGKNPGSASPTVLGKRAPLHIGRDKMLPTVRNCFLEAYASAGKAPPERGFVQVWNLFYLCDPSLTAAIRSVRAFGAPPFCSSEAIAVPIVWFGWGGPHPCLDVFKMRFFGITTAHCFYYDHIAAAVVASAPGVGGFAKHTQGLTKKPVINHLASVL